MPIIITILLIIVALLGAILYFVAKPKKEIKNLQHTESGKEDSDLVLSWSRDEDKYWNGPIPSAKQQEINKEKIFKHLEQFPNGFLAEKNPEYVEEYLNRIDLDLPDGITTEKD